MIDFKLAIKVFMSLMGVLITGYAAVMISISFILWEIPQPPGYQVLSLFRLATVIFACIAVVFSFKKAP